MCYASALGDCGGRRLTFEHYFSKGILKLLSVREIGGFPWQSDRNRPSIDTLGAKILCEKHHRLLSPLDQAAVQVFRFFDQYVPDVVSGWRTNHVVVEMKGELLERWMLKALIGVTASGNVLRDGIAIREYQPLREDLEILFGRARMRAELHHGLYLDPRTGETTRLTERGLHFQPFFYGDRVCGATCRINNICFGLLISGDRSDLNHPLRNSEYRPPGVQVMNWARPSCSAELRLTWSRPGSNTGLKLWWVQPQTLTG